MSKYKRENMKDIQIIDEDRRAELDRVSANVHYQIAQAFTEQDATATIIAIVERYPEIVENILSRYNKHNRGTIKGLNTFMELRKDIFGMGGKY